MQRYLGAVGILDPTNDLDVINEQLARLRKKLKGANAKRKVKAPKKKHGRRRKGK